MQNLINLGVAELALIFISSGCFRDLELETDGGCRKCQQAFNPLKPTENIVGKTLFDWKQFPLSLAVQILLMELTLIQMVLCLHVVGPYTPYVYMCNLHKRLDLSFVVISTI